MPAPAPRTGEKAMKKALIVKGGWAGHEPAECAEIFKTMLEKEGYEVVLSDTLEIFLERDLMESLDLVVPNWTMGNLEPEQEKSLLATVRNGAGLAGWHGGMGDAFRDSTDYQFMVGGQFVAHPGGIIDYEIRVAKPEDPVTAGIGNFRLRSEQYYMHVDPGNEVLAVTTFSGEHCPWIKGCVMPVAWKRRYGKGRVFYSSMGHVAADFQVPEVLEITRRGMLWASR